MKADEATVVRSLRAIGSEECLLALAQAVARCDCLSGQIEQAGQRIPGTMALPAPELEEHTAFPTIGVGTALVLAWGIGPDLSPFPIPGHICSQPIPAVEHAHPAGEGI